MAVFNAILLTPCSALFVAKDVLNEYGTTFPRLYFVRNCLNGFASESVRYGL